MPELLLELFCEEIPARMQARAADDLRRLVTDALVERGLTYAAARAFVGPRRLTLVLDGLSPRQPDRREERRGPRAGAPQAALDGFLRQNGLTPDQVSLVETDKGAFHVAVIDVPGRPTPEVLGEILPAIIRDFPWPKSMRWGSGALRWVRPLQSILCCFDGAVVDMAIEGIRAGETTRGHRFHAPQTITARRFDDYAERLEAAKVVVDPAARRQIIERDARTLAFARHLDLVEDAALLDEVTGLVEWPVVLSGDFDPDFLDVPAEVLTTTMRANQKYFALRDPKTGRLAPHFLVVANLEARDGGRAIVAGNEKVLRARLSDARFFWEQDKRASLDSRLGQLEQIIFHAKLGTLHERAQRLVRLAQDLSPLVPGSEAAPEAARLAKADLVTGMVGEFPELQGVMGRYYALHDGLDPAVADAIRDHYAPLGPQDAVPRAPVSIVVALAEKLDTLAGFFGIDERPTGSKDPFALRRAGLGVIRIILENGLRLDLPPLFEAAARHYRRGFDAAAVARDLMGFLADRLKVHLRERGLSHDLVAAVFALGDQGDLARLVRRAEALKAFLATEDGANLLAAHRRASNILRIEEKKDGRSLAGRADPAGLVADEEKALRAAIDGLTGDVDARLGAEDFAGALSALARLRQPVDAFFTAVTVNADDPALRANRLALLSEIRLAMGRIADFSLIEAK